MNKVKLTVLGIRQSSFDIAEKRTKMNLFVHNLIFYFIQISI